MCTETKVGVGLRNINKCLICLFKSDISESFIKAIVFESGNKIYYKNNLFATYVIDENDNIVFTFHEAYDVYNLLINHSTCKKLKQNQSSQLLIS